MQGYRPPPRRLRTYPLTSGDRTEETASAGAWSVYRLRPSVMAFWIKELTVSSSFLASLASSPEVPLFDANSTEFLID